MPNALPLIVTHGWPGSIIEQLKIIDPLTESDRAWRHRSGRLRRRDPVAAGLRVFRQADRDRLGSDPHRPRLDRADEAPRLHALRGAGRRLGQRGHRADGAARRLRDCSAFTPTCRRLFRPTSPRRLCAGGPAPAGLSPDEQHACDQLDSSTSTASATRRRWRTARRRCTASPIRRSAWPPGCSTTTRAVYELIARVFDGKPEGPDARRRPRQRHALLADEHGGLVGASVLGEQARRSSRPKGVAIPVAVSAFPDETLPGAAELDGAGVSEAHLLQQARQGRPLRGLGAAGTLYVPNSELRFRSLRSTTSATAAR